MTSAFSWQNSVSLCSASFCTQRPIVSVIPGIFLTSYFCIPFPSDEKDMFFLVLVLGLVSLHRTIQLQILSISGWSIDLDYYNIEWFALEMNSDHPFVFEVAPKDCISNSLVDYKGYTISSKGFLPTAVGIVVF